MSLPKDNMSVELKTEFKAEFKINATQCCGLDNSHLVSWNEDDRFLGTVQALDALSALKKAAGQAGFELKLCSAWRSFQHQLRIVDAKMQGLRPILDEHEQPLDISSMSVSQRLQAIMRFSALPGFSRHHFGTDFDIYPTNCLPYGTTLQLTAKEYSEGMYFYDFGQWLSQNLERFAFVRPFSGKGACGYEPWHISFMPQSEICLLSFNMQKSLEALQESQVPWADEACAIASKRYAFLFS